MEFKTNILINSERDLDTAVKAMHDSYKGIESFRLDTNLKNIVFEKEINIKDDISQLEELVAIKFELCGQHILKVNNYQDAFRETFKYVVANNDPEDTRYKTVVKFSKEMIPFDICYPVPHKQGWIKIPSGKQNIINKIIKLLEVYNIDLDKVSLYGI